MSCRSTPGRAGPFRATRAGLLLLLAACLALPGCRGCWGGSDPAEEKKQEEDAEARAKKKKKEEDPFAFEPLATLPPVLDPSQPKEKRLAFWYKPGHWIPTVLTGKANKEDFIGQMEQQVLDLGGDPMPLEAVPYELVFVREISMPRGQEKSFASVLFFPATQPTARAVCRIKTRRGGRSLLDAAPVLLQRMPSYQYHFVVLSDLPERYTYLDKLDTVSPPWEELDAAADTRRNHYLVSLVTARPGRPPPLPDHALQWTAIAAMLWDDVDPTALSLDQQAALLDWLHWGGVLILSGPRTLETLRGSFLADCLPATVPTDRAAARELTAADFVEINERWSRSARGMPPRLLEPVKAWEGTKVKLHAEARYVPSTGELLVERRVGRGRVVASLFRLSGKEWVAWPGVDGFFNACVLGRPPRKFQRGPLGELQVTWADARSPPERLDPARICGLRYFTRDSGRTMQDYAVDVLAAGADDADMMDFDGSYSRRLPPGTGVAAWSDFNAVAKAARESLASSARIEIPDRTFVVWIVAAYLVVLVPLNWAVFRLIDRVEWAWAAAPAIAVVCTIVVIRLAQLDIGFARSVTEIGVLEIQGDYPRGHLTRYTALYTSLSTSYDLTVEDPGGQVQPFPTVSTPGAFRLALGERHETLAYRLRPEVTVPGYAVRSNSTRFVHSEQMCDLDGAIELSKSRFGPLELANRTGIDLRDVGLLRRDTDGELDVAWAGNLGRESVVALEFRPWRGESAATLWDNAAPEVAADARPGDLNLRALLELALNAPALRPGQTRLVGWTEADPGALEVSPSASQGRRATLVVAHLRYGFQRDPEPDVTSRLEVEGTRSSDRTEN